MRRNKDIPVKPFYKRAILAFSANLIKKSCNLHKKARLAESAFHQQFLYRIKLV